MSLVTLHTIILRIVEAEGYETKGSEISWAEEDNNFVVLANSIKELLELIKASSVGGVDDYNPAVEYSNTDPDTYVTYDNNTYRYIGASPSTGITPGTDESKWELVSSGAFTHQQNTDTALALGTEFEVTAEAIKTFLSTGAFNPGSDYEFTGNNQFANPVEIAEATENNHAVTLGQVIAIAELIEIDESGLVHKEGSETITGAKTFSTSPTVPEGASSGSAVNKGQLDTKLDKAIVEVSKTGSFTVDAGDAYKLYVINSGSAVTVTFPTSMSAGLWWDFVSIGTGAVSFVAGSSATLVSADSRLKLRAQYSACRIVARGSNQGLLTGDIVL